MIKFVCGTWVSLKMSYCKGYWFYSLWFLITLNLESVPLSTVWEHFVSSFLSFTFLLVSLQDTNLLESISGLATSFSQILFHSLLICQDVLKISCSVPVSPFPGCLRCLSEHLFPFSEVMLNSWKLCDSNFTAPVTLPTHGFRILTFFLSSSSFSCSYPFPIFHSL